MMQVRYSVFFELDEKSLARHAEFALSLIMVERHLAPFVDIEVIVYTLSNLKAGVENLLKNFGFKARAIALDEVDIAAYNESANFANSLNNLSNVDRICVVRMLADFRLLDRNAHRLLLGTDIFFLRPPQELLRYAWVSDHKDKVLYMADFTSFDRPYKIRYYDPPHLNGLLGDLYCLAPGVHLEASSIMGCLRMIDTWPTSPSRYDPPVPEVLTTPEQQAASILLQPFGGIQLPRERYVHMIYSNDLTVVHTHNFIPILNNVEPEIVHRLFHMVGFDAMYAFCTRGPQPAA